VPHGIIGNLKSTVKLTLLLRVLICNNENLETLATEKKRRGTKLQEMSEVLNIIFVFIHSIKVISFLRLELSCRDPARGYIQ
jgi:hypothetical protein